jgi:transposase-like protein
LAAADACVRHGEIGALLRREGIYSSTLAKWRTQRDEGLLAANSPLARGRKKNTAREMERHVDKLERHNRRLEEELRKARLIIEAQKKIAEILGVDSQNLDNEGND